MESVLTAMGLVFVAELGDKTQLVALGFGARYRLALVLTGVAIAYTASNLLSVVVGGLLGAALPSRLLGIAGGLLFLAFAVRGLIAKEPDEAETEPPPERAVVTTVAVAVFVAELGDKTMLTTATLAAQGNPVLVWIGATIGITLSGTVGVLVGRFGGAHLPDRAVRIGSSLLFAVVGVVLLVANL